MLSDSIVPSNTSQPGDSIVVPGWGAGSELHVVVPNLLLLLAVSLTTIGVAKAAPHLRRYMCLPIAQPRLAAACTSFLSSRRTSMT